MGPMWNGWWTALTTSKAVMQTDTCAIMNTSILSLQCGKEMQPLTSNSSYWQFPNDLGSLAHGVHCLHLSLCQLDSCQYLLCVQHTILITN